MRPWSLISLLVGIGMLGPACGSAKDEPIESSSDPGLLAKGDPRPGKRPWKNKGGSGGTSLDGGVGESGATGGAGGSGVAGAGGTGDSGAAGAGGMGDSGAAGAGGTGDSGAAGAGGTGDSGAAGAGGTGDSGAAGAGGTGHSGAAGAGGTAGAGGSGAAGAGGTTFQLTTTAASSSAVSLQWQAAQAASATRIYLGSEPAASAAASLADQVLVATLDGDASSYTVTGLSAATDVFVRVERDLQGGTERSDGHARTAGGPRAALDSAVREVHAAGPRTLMIVLANGQGSAWQSGPWKVTRSKGEAIAVNSVRRHSIPVGAPQYSIGWGEAYSDSVLDVDHRVYLQLAGPLGAHDILRVQGPNGVDFRLPYSDRYLETPVIQVNQVGYNPRATQRWAYVSGWLGDGGTLDMSVFPAEAAVLQEAAEPTQPRLEALAGLPLTQRSAYDADAGGEVRQIDLSQLAPSENARYRVRIPGVGVSWPTAVSERAALKAYYVVARGLYHNRWGVELSMPHSSWQRPADHLTIFTGELANPTSNYPQSQPKTGQRSLIGGYHDAGDFDQRPMHTVVPELLMRAYELHPSAFSDGQNTIPESGNGIPDILDEALWGIAAWEQLQESDGGVRQGAQSWREPWGFYHADQDPLVYWAYARGANLTARAAGLFAQGARLVQPFHPARASALRGRAIQAWSWASGNGASAANRLYASGELFRLTGEAVYKNAFEAAWAQIGPYGAFSNFASEQPYMGDYTGSGRATTDYILGYVTAPGASSSIVSSTRSWLTKMADDVVSTVQGAHAHRSPRPGSRSQDWGGAATTGKYMDTVVAMLQLGGLSADKAQAYFNALSLAADSALGCNPNGYVYFTGLGSRRVEDPLHLDSLVFVKEGKGVIPGIPAYGPIESAPGTSYTAATIASYYPSFNSQPKGMRYGDVRNLVTCNEFSVWESQAPQAALFAALLGPAALPPSSWLPGHPDAANPLP